MTSSGETPGGTVYGRSPGPPRVMTAIVGAGIVAVIGLGYVAWNSTGGEAETPAVIAAPSSAGSASSAPDWEAAPAPEAAPTLAAGSWRLSPEGEPDTFLSVNGEFAAMSTQPTALTVVAGLADDDCFSFRTAGDRYLRHFNYRLRFDTTDDSDLFRADATFCPGDGAPAGAVRLRSKNYPDHLLHRRDDGTVYIDEPTDDLASFTFLIRRPD